MCVRMRVWMLQGYLTEMVTASLRCWTAIHTMLTLPPERAPSIAPCLLPGSCTKEVWPMYRPLRRHGQVSQSHVAGRVDVKVTHAVRG